VSSVTEQHLSKATTYYPSRWATVQSRCLPKGITPWLLLIPAIALGLVLLVSILVTLRISLGEKNAEWTAWTLANYYELLDVQLFRTIIGTIKLATIATCIALILSYPVALLYCRMRSRGVKLVMLFVILMPVFVNLLLQTYGWVVLAGPAGLINNVLRDLGLIDRPLRLLYSEGIVIAGLVQSSLPLAILPIAASIRNISASLEEAAAVLGASRPRVMLEVVLPLSAPGLWAAFLLTFAFNASAFVVPLLLGGGRVVMISPLVRDQMGPLLNWPLGAALSLALCVVILAAMNVPLLVRAMKRLLTRRPSRVGGP
jgi:putative spermidine/putrescine transport system permease protein